MLNTKMSKSEVEKEIEGKGNFAKIDHLNRFLKEPISMDMKRFVFLKLAELYEKAGLMNDAGKSYNKAGIISITFSDKIKYFVKSAEAYIKAGDFYWAEDAVKKALEQANSAQKNEINSTIKDFYKKQAEAYEKDMKRAQAAKIYERILEMSVSSSEKQYAKEKLSDLYEKLGRTRDYNFLKGI